MEQEQDAFVIEKYNGLCEGPLSKQFIQSRSGGTHKGKEVSYDYVSSNYIARILNDIFGSMGWSSFSDGEDRILEVQEKEITHYKGKKIDRPYMQYTVHAFSACRLVIHPKGKVICTKSGNGTGRSISKDRGEAVAHALKGARTDALKRASLYLGDKFGLAVRGGDGDRKLNSSLGTIENIPTDVAIGGHRKVNNKYPWLSEVTFDALITIYNKNKDVHEKIPFSIVRDVLSQSVEFLVVMGGFSHDQAMHSLRAAMRSVSKDLPTFSELTHFFREVIELSRMSPDDLSADDAYAVLEDEPESESEDKKDKLELELSGPIEIHEEPLRIPSLGSLKTFKMEDMESYTTSLFSSTPEDPIEYVITNAYYHKKGDEEIMVEVAIPSTRIYCEGIVDGRNEEQVQDFLNSLFLVDSGEVCPVGIEEFLEKPESVKNFCGLGVFSIIKFDDGSRRTELTDYCQAQLEF